jgi:hypothetical protein
MLLLLRRVGVVDDRDLHDLVQIEQGLLALLGEYLPFGIATSTLLNFSPAHGEDLGLVVSDLTDVGVTLLEEHPLPCVQDDLIAQLESPLESKSVLNIAHVSSLGWSVVAGETR